tara:strand:+ start:526 stop:747 length:222 start_codon:yes stop_codon:yes gene_type:complete
LEVRFLSAPPDRRTMVDKLEIIHSLRRMRGFMLKQNFPAAYEILLEMYERLYEDVRYREAIEDWKSMSKELRK